MKIKYTYHAGEKFKILKFLGWKFTKRKVNQTIRKPVWIGKSKYGQATAMSLLDKKHILRVIFNRKDDTITVITFHPAQRGTYESTI